MARKSRKNVPVAVAEPMDNLTTTAVLELKAEDKPFQVAVYARLSFESEANRERDTVETQIAYIKSYVTEQTDMIIADVYVDRSVSGTSFDRPEFDRMMQDIRQGKINTVITRDLSRLGRNYIETGNYIERVFPFLDVRYIAITDDFDTARPGTDLSMPLKNIVNEFYSKDLSKKVETGKRAIWTQGGFSEGTAPYGYKRSEDGSRQLIIDEEVCENVKRIFKMFLNGDGYNKIAKALEAEEILSPPKYRFAKKGNIEQVKKSRAWHPSHVKEILTGEYYIGNIVHGKQRKALDTGRKNIKTSKDHWVRVEGIHEALIDKKIFEKTQERIEQIRVTHLEDVKPREDLPKIPENKLVYKIFCGECGASMAMRRYWSHKSRFHYTCKRHQHSAKDCDNKAPFFHEDIEKVVFEVIHQHMVLCVDKMKLVQELNQRKENVMQYEVYGKEIARLRKEEKRINANKSGLYEDYRDGLITAEELCQYQKEYELQIQHIEKNIDEMLLRQKNYEKNFHINEDWEVVVNRYFKKRKLTKELVDTFVSKILCYNDKNVEVQLVYDDFLKELMEVVEERKVCNESEDNCALHEIV